MKIIKLNKPKISYPLACIYFSYRPSEGQPLSFKLITSSQQSNWWRRLYFGLEQNLWLSLYSKASNKVTY